MAALDFPAAPSDGAVFAAPNNVLYQWKATPGMWVVMSSLAAAPGDFHAQSDAAWTPVVGVAPFPNVKTGNSGSWFNTSNNRYTPPAGRFFIYATIIQFATGAGSGTLNIRKNGTMVVRLGETVTAGMQGSISINGIFDANGTDYFDIYVEALGGTGYSGAPNSNCFGAFAVAPPLSPVSLPTAPGDVTANAAPVLNAGVATVVSGYTVLVGNLGSYLNVTTGRYTPPAGRYLLSGHLQAYSSTSLLIATIAFRKNGTAITPAMNATSPAANNNIEASSSMIVDANGSDFFELQATTHVSATAAAALFTAFPLQPALIPYPQAITADFTAHGAPTITNTFAVVLVPTVLTGNTGSYYNPATGRYTPPAGRYLLSSLVGAWNSTVGFGMNTEIRKNGTKIGTTIVATATAANQWVTAPITMEVDASGTDYFEVWAQGLATGGTQCYFSAFPVNPVAPANIPRITVSATAPTTPILNDLWVDTT